MSEVSWIEKGLIYLCLAFKAHEGANGKICKEAFKALLTTELHGYESDKAEEKFRELDTNEDGYLDFKEFCTLIVQVACECHDCIEYIMAQEMPAQEAQ